MKHFSRYVRPNAVMVNVGGNDATKAMAFNNVNGDMVITYSNEGSDKALNIKVGTQTASFAVPGNSFNTFVISNSTSARNSGKNGMQYAAGKNRAARLIVANNAGSLSHLSAKSRVYNLKGRAVDVSSTINRASAKSSPKIFIVQER
jgi:hypothetical protein